MIAKKTREILIKDERKEKIEKIQQKDDKYRKWLVVKKFIQAEKGWIILMVCVSVAQKFRILNNIKKQCKNVFSVNSKLLYQVSRAIGRLMRIIKKNRQRKSLEVLTAMLVPLMQLKLGNILKKFRLTITKTLEIGLTKRLFKRLIPSLKKKVVKVRSGMKNIIEIYKARIDSLLKLWNTLQSSFHTYSEKSIIPPDQSFKIIRGFFYKKLKDFYYAKRNYAINTQRIRGELEKFSQARTKITDRKQGIRLSLTAYIPVLRMHNKEEIVRLYLEEEGKYRIINEKKESLLMLSEFQAREMLKKKSTARIIRSPKQIK